VNALVCVTGSRTKAAANRKVRANRAPATLIPAICSAGKPSARGATSSEKIGGERPLRLRPGRPSATLLLSIDRNERRLRGRVGTTGKCGRFISPPPAICSSESPDAPRGSRWASMVGRLLTGHLPPALRVHEGDLVTSAVFPHERERVPIPLVPELQEGWSQQALSAATGACALVCRALSGGLGTSWKAVYAGEREPPSPFSASPCGRRVGADREVPASSTPRSHLT
jgi:hypothetical protein